MKKVRVKSAGGNFELIEERMRDPDAGCVRVTVQACGICHSDVLTKEGSWPGIVYPRASPSSTKAITDPCAPGAGAQGEASEAQLARHQAASRP